MTPKQIEMICFSFQSDLVDFRTDLTKRVFGISSTGRTFYTIKIKKEKKNLNLKYLECSEIQATHRISRILTILTNNFFSLQ